MNFRRETIKEDSRRKAVRMMYKVLRFLCLNLKEDFLQSPPPNSHANVISYSQWVQMEQERKKKKKKRSVGIDNRSIIAGISLGSSASELFLFVTSSPDITAVHISGNAHINLMSFCAI
jgi:hypothetical protein